MYGLFGTLSVKQKHSMLRRQKGIATILIMLMVGLALTVTVLGLTQYINVSQDKLLTVHTQTQSQLKAWTGVEAIRQYLTAVATDEKLDELAEKIKASGDVGLPLKINGLTNLSAKFISVDDTNAPTLFTANITGTSATDTKGQSNSILQVVFNIENETTVSAPPRIAPANFNEGLKVSGGIAAQTEEGDESGYELNVIGDITTSGNAITGFSVLNSTGSVDIGSGSSFNVINANCDVRLTGAVTAETINARRHICLPSGGGAGTTAVNANGSVLVGSSASQGAIAAIGDPIGVDFCRATGSKADDSIRAAATCDEPNPDYVVDFGDDSHGSSALSIKAKGGVRLAGTVVGDIQAEGDLLYKSGSNVTSGVITGSASGPVDDKTSVTVTENNALLKVDIPYVSEVTLTSIVINAYDYKDIANYVFFIVTDGDIVYKKVKIHNVNGIEDGTYFIGNFGGSKQDYACAFLSPDAPSWNPFLCDSSLESTAKKIGVGYSDSNSLIGYSDGEYTTTQWNLNGKSLAPGIAWFDGNLNVGSGEYYNTFIVTKNITTSGSDKVYAPNYAGYSGTVDSVEYAPTGICVNSYFPDLYPTQFCDVGTSTYLQNGSGSVGNYALIAGSKIDADYIGGNITTGAKTEIFGNVIAGNQFVSSGETIVHGSISALAAGDTVALNALSAKTTIVLKNLPDTFTWNEAPSLGSSSGSNTGSTSTGQTVTVKWSRYL